MLAKGGVLVKRLFISCLVVVLYLVCLVGCGGTSANGKYEAIQKKLEENNGITTIRFYGDSNIYDVSGGCYHKKESTKVACKNPSFINPDPDNVVLYFDNEKYPYSLDDSNEKEHLESIYAEVNIYEFLETYSVFILTDDFAYFIEGDEDDYIMLEKEEACILYLETTGKRSDYLDTWEICEGEAEITAKSRLESIEKMLEESGIKKDDFEEYAKWVMSTYKSKVGNKRVSIQSTIDKSKAKTYFVLGDKNVYYDKKKIPYTTNGKRIWDRKKLDFKDMAKYNQVPNIVIVLNSMERIEYRRLAPQESIILVSYDVLTYHNSNFDEILYFYRNNEQDYYPYVSRGLDCVYTFGTTVLEGKQECTSDLDKIKELYLEFNNRLESLGMNESDLANYMYDFWYKYY